MIKLRAIIRRRWLLLVLATVLGCAGGVVSTLNAPNKTKPVYEIEQLVVANRNSSQTGNIQQDSLRVTRGVIPVDAATKLGHPERAQDYAGRITATAASETSTISIMTSAEDVEPAKKLVTAFVDAFLSVTNSDLRKEQARRMDELEKRAATATDQRAQFDAENPEAVPPEAVSSTDTRVRALANQRQQLLTAEANAANDVLALRLSTSEELPYAALGDPTVRLAKTSLLNVPTSPTIRASLLGFIGLLLGIGLVLIIERANQRIDTREELAEAVGVPIIAEIGHLPKGRRSMHPDGRLRLEGVWAEPYRRVRAAIQFVQTHGTPDGSGGFTSPRVFLVTSAQPGEGKSTSAALTALALAEIDVPTVVVGADFRRPQVENLLGDSPGPTLQDIAQLAIDRPTVDDVVRPTVHSNLWLATGGPSTREVAPLVIATKELVLECRRRGATVIIDSSPLQAANDTVDLLEVVDEVILIVRSGDSTAAGLIDSVELLRQLGAHLMGVVLVGTPGVGRLQIYYDGYYTQPTQTKPAEAT